jgi:hypothetical protein
MSCRLVGFLHVQFTWKLKQELFVIEDWSQMHNRYSRKPLSDVPGLKHKTSPTLEELQQSDPEQVPEDCSALLPKLNLITIHPMRERNPEVADQLSTWMTTGEVSLHWACRGNCCQYGLVRRAIDLQATSMPATSLRLPSIAHHVGSQV